MCAADGVAEFTACPSGKLGDTIFSHNRFAPYTRPYVAPVQPGSLRQLNAQNKFAAADAQWKALTNQQREAWRPMHIDLRRIDRIGQERQIHGYHHFMRANIPRALAGIAPVVAPPKIHEYAQFRLPSIVVNSALPGSEIEVTFALEPWIFEDNSAMLLYGYNQVPNTVNFYKHPFIFFNIRNGSSIPPHVPTISYASPFTLTPGDKLPIGFRLCLADGRTSHFWRKLVPIS